MGDLIKFKRMVGHLAEQLKLEGLEPDEEGSCYLAFDEDLMMKCSILHDSNQIEMVSYVGMLSKDSPAVLMEMLKCNHFWSDTAGANLGLSTDDNTVMLSHRIDMDFVDEDRFYKIVENFVNAMDHWKVKFPELYSVSEHDVSQGVTTQGSLTTTGDSAFMMGV